MAKISSTICVMLIDGHHSMLKERGCAIPEPFFKFVGSSTHRKRQRFNLSYDTLVKHVAVLRESRLASWMQ